MKGKFQGVLERDQAVKQNGYWNAVHYRLAQLGTLSHFKYSNDLNKTVPSNPKLLLISLVSVYQSNSWCKPLECR